MKFSQIFFREIDLFDFTSFFGLDFLKFYSLPAVNFDEKNNVPLYKENQLFVYFFPGLNPYTVNWPKVRMLAMLPEEFYIYLW